jgi:hypothetical protein
LDKPYYKQREVLTVVSILVKYISLTHRAARQRRSNGQAAAREFIPKKKENGEKILSQKKPARFTRAGFPKRYIPIA